MTPITQEWVDKAEGDYATAGREHSVKDFPNHDAVCFHAQQCAEKYLKARMQEASMAIPFTHNLVALLQDILLIEPAWASLQNDLLDLSAYAVGFRYPGNDATLTQADTALKTCAEVRAAVRQSLGLP